MSHGAGKGDSPRRRQIPYEEYAANYDRIFRRQSSVSANVVESVDNLQETNDQTPVKQAAEICTACGHSFSAIVLGCDPRHKAFRRNHDEAPARQQAPARSGPAGEDL